jgi:transposase InsO family protein
MNVIKANKDKYSISAMCRYLGVTRSLVYYKPTPHKPDVELENAVIQEFNENRQVYGRYKIKRALRRRDEPLNASCRRIGKIMDKHGLVSKYVRRRKKRKKTEVNEEDKPNIVNREFDNRKTLEVVVSDLTYVKVGGKGHYICLLLDIANRDIIGSAVGRQHDAKLVRKAFYRADVDLRNVDMFHTDRGTEFKNEIIDDILHAFNIRRSLSAKGTPTDNAVMESLYNIIKTELIFGMTFHTIEDLELELFDFVNWYNHKRLHGSLDYLPPREYKALKQKQEEERS